MSMDETLKSQPYLDRHRELHPEAHAAYEAKQRYIHVPQRPSPHGDEMPWDRTIRELREENARLTAALARLPESDNPTVGESVVDNVVDALNRRVVPPPDRTRLRDALDKADAPQPGRAGADEALGRAIRWSEK